MLKIASYPTFLIFFFLAKIVTAQSTFFNSFPSSNHVYIYNAIELPDGEFILSGTSAMDYNSPNHAYLIKLSSTGNYLTDNINIESDTTSTHTMLFLHPGYNRSFIALTTQNHKSNGITKQAQTFNKYNQNLERMVIKKTFSPPDYEILPQSILIDTDSCVFIQSTLAQNNPSYLINGSIITKYSSDFDSLSSLFRPSILAFCAGMLKDSITQTYKSFTMYPGIIETEFNNEMQLIKEVNLPYFVTNACATPFSRSHYLMTGTYADEINWNRHIKIRKFSSDEICIDSVSYFNNADTTLYAGSVLNTCVINHTIFTVGNHNFIPSGYPWQQSPSWLQITRLDTSLNVIDHHFYGGDAFYMPYKIFKTSDGGAFIAGSRYDFHNPELVYHPFALKVNSEGLITDLPDDSPYKAHDAIVYPNPGSEDVIVHSGPQIEGAVFTLFDMQGKVVLSQTIHSTEQHFDTKNLSSGTYPWRISFKNKVIENGKWIKR